MSPFNIYIILVFGLKQYCIDDKLLKKKIADAIDKLLKKYRVKGNFTVA